MKNIFAMAGWVGVLGCLLAVPAGGAVRTGENSGGEASQRTPAAGPAGRLEFQADLFTGRFGYQVPLELAPGRHGSAPAVGLQYNSAGENGWCGVGWDLDLGYIQRETKRGVPVGWANGVPVKAYDDAKGFVFSLNGRSSALVNVTNWEYRAEIEGGFLRFVLQTNANQWQVTDPGGNLYVFGQTTNSRMSNRKSGWPSNAWNGTFRWALARVETVLGDTTDISYTNAAGTLYPVRVGYNGHVTGLTNSHTVDFVLGGRSDVKLSYVSGYRVVQDRRLAAIVHKAGGQVVWSNRLGYAQSPSTTRSLLQSVTRWGTNLTAGLPPVTFGYSTQQFGFQPLTYWTNLSIPPNSGEDYYFVSRSTGDGRLFLDLVDLDGDGRPDRVFQTNNAPWRHFWMQRNNGHGFDNPRLFGPLSVQTYTDGTVGTLTTSNDVNWVTLNSGSARLLDLDGDGRPDRVADPLESYSSANGHLYTNLAVQLNAGTNWASGGDVRWTNVWATNSVPGDPATMYCRAVENRGAVAMLDLNGDGLPDRVFPRAYGSPAGGGPFTNYWVQFNTGAGFTAKQAWGPLTYECYQPGTYGGTLSSTALRLLDLNGDGLPDRVMYPTNAVTRGPEPSCSAITNLVVEFNNGHGFEPPVNWTGLIGLYTTCGNNFCAEGIFGPSIQDSADRVFRDLNGDGLPDRILRHWQCNGVIAVSTNWVVQFNLGTNFSPLVWAVYGPHSSQGVTLDDYTAIESTHARLLDIDGDGLPDRVMPSYPSPNVTNRYAVELSKGPFPDLLVTISNGLGGAVSATYQPSTQYDNRESTNALARQLLPFPMQTVASVSASDGLYPGNTTRYAYEGGMWNAARREFHGFARVTVSDPLGLTNVHWFHQAGGRDHAAFGEHEDTPAQPGKKGMAYRVDTFGTNGQPYKLTLSKVEDADLGNGRHFAYVSQTLTVDYPGGTSAYRATAEQFACDLATGNLTNQFHLGEVTNVIAATHGFTDVGHDSVYQFTTFATLANTNLLDKPARSIVTADSAGQNLLRESLFSYDGQTGNQTQQRDRICAGSYRTNRFGYDGHGNRVAETNAAGIVTTTVYDAAYQTFPAQQVTGGSFTNTWVHDARSGQVQQAVDAKGLVTSNAFDAFLRVIETSVSTTSHGAPTQWLARYDYRLGMANGFSTNSVRVRRNDDSDAHGRETWTYSDGLGRVFQVRAESETNNVFRVADTVYDARGNVRFESLPYFSTGTNYTKAVTGLGTLRAYDPAGRLTNVTAAVTGTFSSGLLTGTSATGGDTGSPVGSVGLAYADGNNPWALVATDEEGKVHKYLLDAYGRTNQIVEVTGGGNYTTTLRYDAAGLLTNITDHATNRIEYAYNDLGEVVAMADPDLGVWHYHRDYAGRLREQVDAKTNTIRFDYTDALGRLKAKLVYTPQGAFAYGVTNVYDTSDDGNFPVFKGQLYRTTDNQGWQKQGYDVRGRVLRTARYLSQNGQTYTNQFTCDNADRVTQQVYPNGGPVVTNVFDAGGNLAQVKQVGGSNTVFFAARGFNALGQSFGANFGNGVVTTNDYFANSKRLKRVVTYKTGSTNLQDLSYTYDNVSNLKSIGDSVYTGTASAALTNLVYDDLHRLTSLTRPAVSQTMAFSHSAIGNLTLNGEAGAGSYTYGTRLPHAVRSANGVNYTYDQCGNMFSRGAQSLAYDSENRLVYVGQASPAMSVWFGYDGNGARLWKQGTNTLQVWIGANYEEKNGKTLFHILAGGALVCTFDATGTNVFEYYHPDHLRSTSVLTDKNGYRIQHHEYTAFGRDRFTESTTAFPLSKRYTSQVLDEDTGLYFYGARYYDPQLGRFIQADSIIAGIGNPQNLNRYSYALNNPLRFTDPTGHAPEEGDDDFDVPLTLRAGHAAVRRAAGAASATLYEQSVRDARTTAAIGRAAAELNPIVGGYHAGSQVLTGQDAVDYHKLTGKERFMSGVDVGLQGSGKVLKAGATIGAIVYVKRAAKAAEEAGQVARVGRAAATEFRAFKSFDALKRALGPAGEGRVWHHIVEQRTANVETFGAQAIHNTQNVVNVTKEVNQTIANYYSTKRLFTEGKTIRDWLGSQSFQQQTAFGKQTLNRVLNNQPLP